MFALMFLKHYTGLSDEKLLECLNYDWRMQYFCGIDLGDSKLIKDNAFVSNVRTYIARHFDLDTFQTILVTHWKDEIPDINSITVDATCYESYIRYPTDVKILNESLEIIFQKHILLICEFYKIRKPSLAKYEALRKEALNYSKSKRKTKKATKNLIDKLLRLLSHGVWVLKGMLEKKPEIADKVNFGRLGTIEKVLEQQKFHFHNPKEPVKDRIVSLHKPYVRPIVRGKENKPVEFGIKANKIQIGGISIIQKASYDAYNECNTLIDSVEKSELLVGKITKLGADQIYATNANRIFVREKKIITNFARKGPKPANDPTSEDRKKLGITRSTTLEGSFGNEKNHYGLLKIKAKNKGNELVWLYFGIITSNVVKIAEQREKKLQAEKQKLLATLKAA